MSVRPPSYHPATAWINLDRIRDNYRALRAYAGAQAVIPVLKANAYGHGAVAVARALEPLDVSMFAVAYVDEAITLRQAGIMAPLLVLTGFVPAQLSDLLRFQLTPVISTHEQVGALERAKDGCRTNLSIHVKVDTGMTRLGFSIAEIEPIIHRLKEAEGVLIEGLMTHLASADEDQIATARQLDDFQEAVARFRALGVRPRLVHAANSAGMMAPRDSHTAARPGLLLYGVAPRPLSPNIAVRPALELRARVAMVKPVAAGTFVSYGGTFVTDRESRIATINIGYADGLPRTTRMRERGVAVRNQVALRVAGTVCMDLTMLDATDTPDLVAGDEVTLLGDSPTAWDLADWAGTNAWQVLAGIGARVPRRYTLGGEIVDETLATLGPAAGAGQAI
ncbi:MAG: alanine racemase [Vicinamibacteria bacterium]|nr:alanine racemase [Vicinamibacteria bacterium]